MKKSVEFRAVLRYNGVVIRGKGEKLTNGQKIVGYVRKACEDYDMIRSGDAIAVGVSAGKDSLTLLWALSQLRAYYPESFTLKAITVDVGFPGADFSGIADFCEALGVEYTVVPTKIYDVVFGTRKEKNPCSLCANLRRGAINNAATALGCNKVALGHNREDVAETVLLNLFYAGRFGCFSPVTGLDRSGVTVIRPLIYAPEKAVASFARAVDFPVIKSTCPANGNTKREDMKLLLEKLEKDNRSLLKNIFTALGELEKSGFEKHTRTERITRCQDSPAESQDS